MKILYSVPLALALFLSAYLFVSKAGDYPMHNPKELPEFNRCTCDSATYCLDDSDIIELHMWHDSIQHLSGSK